MTIDTERMEALRERSNDGETSLRKGKDRDRLSVLDPSKSKQNSKTLRSMPATDKGVRSIKERMDMILREGVSLPSEGGKASYDSDFKAGFKAGEKAYKADDSISKVDADKAYKRVSRKHGSWWVSGFASYIDLKRGAYNTSPAQIAKKMHLGDETSI